MRLQLKRSNVLASGSAKTPTASQLEYGELAINYNTDDPAIFLKDSNNNVIRISGVGNIADDGQVELPATTTPPSNPQSGNLWYNSDDGRLYIYYTDADSSQWVDASPDSWDPTVLPDTTNSNSQSGTLDDRYLMLNSGNDPITGGLNITGGNVGIGTSTPNDYDSTSNNLVVGEAGTGDRGITIASGTSHRGTLMFADGTTGLGEYAGYLQYNHNGDYLAIATNNSEAMRITSSGNVGIGTSSPSMLLDVRGASNPQIKVSATNTGTNSAGLFIENQGQRNWQIWADRSLDQLKISHNSRASTVVAITDSRVGIGTTSPSQLLDLASTAPNIRLTDTVDGHSEIDGNAASLKFNADKGNAKADSTIIFAVDNSEKMRIASDGHVGIGNSDPEGILTLGAFGGSSQLIRMRTGTAQIAGIDFGDDDHADMGRIRYHHNGDFLGFFTSRVQRIRVDIDGLKFGADTAAANALDDYEEGLFTPQLESADGNFSAVYTTSTGKYTKVGGLVSVTGRILCSSTNSSGNALRVNGLPFNNVNSGNERGSGTVGIYTGFGNSASNRAPNGLVMLQFNNKADLQFNLSTTTTANVNGSSCSSSGISLFFSIQYFTGA
jgi:hypothetical protein